MEENLKKKFPSLETARACVTQNEYSYAADIYSEIVTAAESIYERDTPEINLLYVEYSHALISEAYTQNINNIKKLMDKQNINVETADYLETAWELLELSRLYYEKIGNSEMLNRVHFLLGEVCLNNDRVDEALEEYSLCEENIEVINNKALCLEFLKRYDESVAMLEKIDLVQYPELREEIILKIEAVKERQSRPPKNSEEIKEKFEGFEEDEKVIDINKLIRRK